MVGQAGGSGGTGAKRGRPPNSATLSHASHAHNNDSDASGSAPPPGLQPILGPSLQVQNLFAEQNNRRIVMALQSGLKGELTWALNTLTMLSFKEKDNENRKDLTPLAKVPGLLDALLRVISEWRDISHARESAKFGHPRSLGVGRLFTGFGYEQETLSSADPLFRFRAIGRLLRVVQTPHALAEICRKAALTLESLASEPQNRALLMSFENCFMEVALTDVRMSDIFA